MFLPRRLRCLSVPERGVILMKNLSLTFAVEKATDRTIMFKEVIDSEDMLAVRSIGNIYVPKATLRTLGWQGERLQVAFTPGEKVTA